MLGIFDSGIGGLTVVKEIFKVLPGYRILYFGDTGRTPYGTRSAETIINFAIQDAEFLAKKGAKIIIIACHTASAVARDLLPKRFFNTPIFEVITPGAKKALRLTQSGRIGVLGTEATIKSGAYEKIITSLSSIQPQNRKSKPKIKVFSQACPLLIPLVEENWVRKPVTKLIVKKYLHPLKMKHIDTLILGCTHLPLLSNIIHPRIGKKVGLVDPGREVALFLKDFLNKNPEIKKSLDRGTDHQFYVSDLTDRFKKLAERFLGREIKLKEILP